MIPELLWIALVEQNCGPHRAVEVITSFTRDLRASHPDRDQTIWAAAGKFETIPPGELHTLVQSTKNDYAEELCDCLRPLAAWYPKHPLNSIFNGTVVTPEPTDLDKIKSIVEDLFDRASWLATMTQATAVWLAFDCGRLKVASHLVLAEFPKIQDYPESELSQKIAASIRSSLNGFFGDTNVMASESDWAASFWNWGLELQPCEDFDE